MSDDNRKAIHLHIDRLVLDGLSLGVAGQKALKDAIETELAGRLASAAQVAGAVPADVGDGADPARLGRAIAHALHRAPALGHILTPTETGRADGGMNRATGGRGDGV